METVGDIEQEDPNVRCECLLCLVEGTVQGNGEQQQPWPAIAGLQTPLLNLSHH